MRRLLADRALVIGAALAIALIAISVIGPHLVGDPLRVDVEHGLSIDGAPLPPSAHAVLGTDALGRDELARVVSASGTSLSIAAFATALALALGLSVGLAAGYAGGWIDAVLMRTVDAVLAFPALLVAMLLATVFRESGLGGDVPIAITLALVGWTTTARVVRGKAMQLARSPFVVAARALGASGPRVIVRHVLPNLAGTAAALTTLAFAQNLLSEAVLSYLGLGPPPPAPTWGRMLYEGRDYYRTAPHLVIVPGIAIAIAVVAFNLIGDGIRTKVRR